MLVLPKLTKMQKMLGVASGATIFVIGGLTNKAIDVGYKKLFPDAPTILRMNGDTIFTIALETQHSNLEKSADKVPIGNPAIGTSSKRLTKGNDVLGFNGLLDIKTIYPKMKGVLVSGQSAYLENSCPTISDNDKTIEIKPDILDEAINAEIGAFRITITEIDSSNRQVEIQEQDYGFKSNRKYIIKNPMLKAKYLLEYGFFLKRDSVQEYPRYHRITCPYEFKE